MTDTEFVSAFEACTLPPDLFHHRDHIRLAWLYLREEELPEALARYRNSIRRFASSLGQSQLYHETITFAYLLLIHDRMQRDGGESWCEFESANRDLFSWNPSILDDLYAKETLKSDLARSTYLLPDAQRA